MANVYWRNTTGGVETNAYTSPSLAKGHVQTLSTTAGTNVVFWRTILTGSYVATSASSGTSLVQVAVLQTCSSVGRNAKHRN